jgi:hypothetical protein
VSESLQLPMAIGMESGACLSADRRYRYRLWRSWGDPGHRCAFVMLNPSTADETEPDHTITKCIGFATRWDFGGLDVVNLFGWRSTDMRMLKHVADPVGPDNDATIRTVITDVNTHRVVLAWGSHGPVRSLIKQRLESMHGVLRLPSAFNFGRNADGQPKHPLTLAYDTPLVPA